MFNALMLSFRPKQCSLKRCILLISIIIGQFSFVQHYKHRQQEIKANNQAANSPFFIAHVLDPTVDTRFKSWTRQEWLNWYQLRENLHQRASPKRRTKLTEKAVNSVLITSPTELVSAFGNKHPYNPRGNTEPTYWGDRQFPSFVFLRFRIGGHYFYRIYDCPPMHIAVKFVKGMPVHLQAHRRMKEDNQNVNLSKHCRQLIN